MLHPPVALLFEPGIAMVITGLGTLLAQALRRQPWDQMLFNSAQTALQAGVGGLLMAGAGWDFAALRLDRPALLFALVLAAGAMYLIDTLAVATIVGLQSHRSLLAVWRQITGFEALEFLAQYALGVLAAIVADAHLLALPFLLPPAFVVYRSSVRHLHLREQALALEHQAFHDTLTRLPNRTLFMDRLQHAMARSARRHGTFAVLFLDLDRFKVVNDSLGHETGDRLLVAVAERLRDCLRPEDTAARFGGDEFIILLEDTTSVHEAVQVAERILGALRAPFRISKREVVVSASIGIVLDHPERQRPAELLRDVDVAMYRAKAKGKATYEVFDLGMNARALERLEREADLRRALARGELRVYYQPKVVLATGRLFGAEALVRWEHPRRGLLLPGEFVPLAEETGLIQAIDRWVLGEACRQARIWHERYPSDPPLLLSVNISARQFLGPDLVADVARVLQETRAVPGSVALEITEGVLMEDVEATIATLQGLKDLGLLLAIDDFGMGYSSLSYLKRFSVNILKIDRAFVAGLGRVPEDTAIVEAVIGLARALGLLVTAEGVETAAQAAQLHALGCTLGQGYYFARPLPSDATEALVAAGLPPSGRAGHHSPPAVMPAGVLWDC